MTKKVYTPGGTPSGVPKYNTVETVAWFHGFTQEGEEGGMTTMAIVEHDDGTCETVHISTIKFAHPGGG
jgi:hypothetical protein